MAWRVLSHGGKTWHVHVAAERRPNHDCWQLILSFRASGGLDDRRAFWAAYPLEAASKASLYAQAERISNDALQALLVAHVS